MAGVLAIGLGLFDALSTWLEPLFLPFGLEGAAGNLLGLTILSGMVGAASLAPQVLRLGLYRTFLHTATSLAAVMNGGHPSLAPEPLDRLLDDPGRYFLLAGLPVLMDLVGAFLGTERQSAAVGVMMVASHREPIPPGQ